MGEWSRPKFGNVKLILCATKQLIAIVDVVQDFMQLSLEEIHIKRDLKARYLGLTIIAKLKAKQSSKLTNIRAFKANSNFFLQANGRKR
jgi:hypothetical protein